LLHDTTICTAVHPISFLSVDMYRS